MRRASARRCARIDEELKIRRSPEWKLAVFRLVGRKPPPLKLCGPDGDVGKTAPALVGGRRGGRARTHERANAISGLRS